MSKNKSSPLSEFTAHQQEQFDHINRLGQTLASLHFIKMSGRTQRWLGQAQEYIRATIDRGELPTKWMWIKIDLLQWLYRHYFEASVNPNKVSV